MGGGVVFSEGNGVALSTIQVNRLVHLLREEVRLGERDVFAELFAPLDDGMNFLTAVDLSSEQYKVVCDVIERAYFRSKCSGHPVFYEGWWNWILEAMARDARYPPRADASRGACS